ncbi:DUF262 domain-containing protein [Kingella negevensis]|uniref:DUF262 domain-containing protein n=1 Tax=Kingella negevensis TaxID=1522312 RepID=UPI00254C6D66|nr:DUF262 domain-containing protein [Kingella negevensis]MDK4685655.1 DUF262 domain-containing protein [Kingella negevensis]MDK4707303.1 DUF262 domain-containing protein [Kingella negevensis]MDK4710219.1 DUF262 domain-containing protein [Kingella negevensis]
MHNCQIHAIQSIFQLPLHIPHYQRPYKWQAKHILQLLQDLQHHHENNIIYRIGTVVLHNDSSRHEIVDGQQRLITLSLIVYALTGKQNGLLAEKLNHSTSRHNVVQNYQFIQHYCRENFIENKQNFANYILQTCEMVCVTLDNLDEAFQFFDSQNARGKPLEPYDLLKAYHLREMQQCRLPESQIFPCVERWEHTALLSPQEINLHKIISKTLFPLRRWHERESGEHFTIQQLDTFKGVSSQQHYPYLMATKFAYPHIQAAFQINQVLLNGKYFFDFIEYYRDHYRHIFDKHTGKLSQISSLADIHDYLQHHHGTGKGMSFLRQLFECTVLLYVDKFGEIQLDRVIRKIFVWVYQMRLTYQRIEFASVDNYANHIKGLLVCIQRAKQPSDVWQYINPILQPSEVRYSNVHSTLFQILGVEKTK